MDFGGPEQTRAIVYTSLAGLGGALGYIYRENRAGRAIRLGRVLLTSVLAAFIGYHMILVYQSLGLPEQIIGALNGLTALLGVEFMLFVFEKVLFKKLGISYEQRITQALLDAGWTPPHGAANLVPSEPIPTAEGAEQTVD